MRLKPVILSLCAILSLGAPAGAKAPKPDMQVQYEVKIKSASFGDMGTRKLWMKGNHFRWESYSGRLPVWLIRNDQGLFLINPFRKIAAKYPSGAKRGDPMELLPGPTGSIPGFLRSVKAVKHGKTTLNKQPCTNYSYTEPATGMKCELSVGVKSGRPVQLVIKGKHKVADTVTATYTKFDAGTSIPESRFELPKGYPIRSMPSEVTSEKATQQAGNKKSG